LHRRLGRRAGPLALGLSLAAAAGWLAPAAAPAAQVQSLFPSDRLTVPDPRQSTGRRVALPPPDCAADPSGCDEVQLLDELDGFSVNPRVAIRFSDPVDPGSVSRDSAFILPLWAEPLPSPVGLGRLVWDGEGRTLYARPERMLLQTRRYALVLTTRIRDESGQPLVPAAGPALVSEAAHGVSARGLVFQQLRALGVPRGEVAAVAVFTTQSVTTWLEQMCAAIWAAPAPALRFVLGPAGAHSAFARVELDRIDLRRHVATDPAARLAEPEPLPLGLVPPTEIRTIAFGRLGARSFLAADRHIPTTATRAEAPAPLGSEDVDATVFLPAGTAPHAGWPVAIFGHGWGGDRHLTPMVVAGTMARAGFATVAINVVGHGGGPEGTLTVRRTGREPITLPAGGRGVDLNGDGRIGATEGVRTRVGSALALIGTNLSRASVVFMGWFGPRGLASIVLGLVYLERGAALAGESTIRLTVMATVLLSIFAHGLSAMPGIDWYARRIATLDPSAPEFQAAGEPVEILLHAAEMNPDHTKLRIVGQYVVASVKDCFLGREAGLVVQKPLRVLLIVGP
jgi:hypothetical protein